MTYLNYLSLSYWVMHLKIPKENKAGNFFRLSFAVPLGGFYQALSSFEYTSTHMFCVSINFCLDETRDG